MYKTIFILLLLIIYRVNAQDISLNIATNQKLYTLGETITIEFNIYNQSNNTYKVNNSYTINDFDISLKDDNGKVYIPKKLFSMSSNMDIINPKSITHQSYDLTDVIKISNLGWYRLYVNKHYSNTVDNRIIEIKSNVTYFKVCNSMSYSIFVKLNNKVIKDNQIILLLSIQNVSDIDYNVDLFNYNIVIVDNIEEKMIEKSIKPGKMVKNILHPGDVLSIEYSLNTQEINIPNKLNIFSYIKFNEKNSNIEDFFVSNSQVIKMGEVK
jgi:hypothetical protein